MDNFKTLQQCKEQAAQELHETEFQFIDAAYSNDDRGRACLLYRVTDLAAQIYADQFELKWMLVSERLPDELDNCLFVVDLPHDHRHGKVYGGVYTGDPLSKNADRRNEFSTPGISFPASQWMLSPKPPKR